MFNWRRFVLRTTAGVLGRKMFKYFEFLKKIENETLDMLNQRQEEKLSKLLLHAHANVPYYQRILNEAAVVRDGKVCLENFQRIPILTKDIIRREGECLYSKDYKKRSWFPNTTGGSTGEPVSFIQDRDYKDWGFAHTFYFNLMAGKKVGEPEIKLWGSERDILNNSEKFMTILDRKLFNVTILNSFLMSEENMNNYVKKWNAVRPKLVNAYTSSIYDFARHIKASNSKIFQPHVILCSAETLTPDVRNLIEKVFGCPALNHYGSRDAGVIACECLKKEGLHTFPTHTKIEILDDNLMTCPPGQVGNVYVTTLDNFSMPLIRYSIGDMAVPAENEKCSCGRGAPLIANVVGRHIEVFKTREGKVVPGEFFIHFIGVVYNKNYIKKFQVVQKDYDRIVIRLVISDTQKFNESKTGITDSIQKVMGQNCKVEFEPVDDIQPTKSGKYLYTVSEI